jgi:hypothetical protein
VPAAAASTAASRTPSSHSRSSSCRWSITPVGTDVTRGY